MLVMCVGVAMPPVWRVTRRYFCDAARAAVVGPPRTMGGCIYIYRCYMVSMMNFRLWVVYMPVCVREAACMLRLSKSDGGREPVRRLVVSRVPSHNRCVFS